MFSVEKLMCELCPASPYVKEAPEVGEFGKEWTWKLPERGAEVRP